MRSIMYDFCSILIKIHIKIIALGEVDEFDLRQDRISDQDVELDSNAKTYHLSWEIPILPTFDFSSKAGHYL